MSPDGQCAPPPQLTGALVAGIARPVGPEGPLISRARAASLPHAQVSSAATTMATTLNAGAVVTTTGTTPIASVKITGVDLNRDGIPDVLQANSSVVVDGGSSCGTTTPTAPQLGLPAGSRIVPREEYLSPTAAATMALPARQAVAVNPAHLIRSVPIPSTTEPRPSLTTVQPQVLQAQVLEATPVVAAPAQVACARPCVSQSVVEAATIPVGQPCLAPALGGVVQETRQPCTPTVLGGLVQETLHNNISCNNNGSTNNSSLREPFIASALHRPQHHLAPPVSCLTPPMGGGLNTLASVPWPPPPLPPAPLDLAARVEALEQESVYSSVDVTVDERIRELEISIAAERSKAAAAGAAGVDRDDPGQRQQWEQSFRDLEIQRNEKLRELNQLKRQKQMDEDDKARLLAEFQQLKRTRDTELAEYEELSSRLQEVETECSQLRKECEEWRSRLGLGSDWQIKHDSIREEKSRLGKELEHWQSQHDTHSTAVEEWKQRHEVLIVEWETRHADTHKAMEARHNEIHEDWMQKHARMDAEWRRKHQEADKERQQITKDISAIQRDFEEEKRLREEAVSQHQQVQRDMDSAQGDLKHLELLCHKHASSKEEAERIHSQMQQDLQRVQADFRKVQEDMALEQKARSAAESLHQEAERDLQKLQIDVDQLSRECDDEVRQRDEKRMQLVRLTEQKSRLSAEMDRDINRLQLEAEGHSERRRSSISVGHASLSRQLVDLRRQLQEVQSQNAQLKAECDALDRESRTVRDSTDEEVSAIKLLNKELETLRSEIEVLAAQNRWQQDVTESRRLSARMSVMNSQMVNAASANRRVTVNLLEDTDVIQRSSIDIVQRN